MERTKVVLKYLAIFQVFMLYNPVLSENFYQQRNHRDQSKYDRYRKEAVKITNVQDVEVQLEKYGYLQCKLRRRRSPDIGDYYSDMAGRHSLHENVEEELRTCSERELKDAILQYQKTYKLPATGVVDTETIKLMSTSRCGNKDTEKTEATEPTPLEEGSETVADPESDFITRTSASVSSQRRPWKRSAKSTLLMQTLQKVSSTPNFISKSRRRFLHEHINKLKEEDPFIYKQKREKRSLVSIQHAGNKTDRSFWDGQKFSKDQITWRLLENGFSIRIPVSEQSATLNLAFRMWSEVIPVKFVEHVTGDVRDVDIEIAFGRGSHQNCDRQFDGHGGEIAHSWGGRNVHFDDEEDYKSIESADDNGIFLLKVAVHEIGHFLGLNHNDKEYSIMYAIYHQNRNIQGPPAKEFELGWEDRKQIQKIYGVCKGKFSTIFDWVRKRPDNQFIFNTYFFRNNYYWMYENRANRTRYGDPLYIAREWKGVPNGIDGYLHIWYIFGKDIIDQTFFFKGANYYKYNSEADEVYEGWPRAISEDFGPKDGETEGIPDNLDSVFFDMRDRNIYFFKGEYVYVYDPKEPEETRGCCVRTRLISEEFPALEGEDPLPPDLDAVYYSYTNQTVYFFKGEDVWENVYFHPRQKQIRNGVTYIGKWYGHWYDICDARNMNALT